MDMFGRRLCCGECGEVVKYKERVFLDIVHTVLHQKCYQARSEIIDRGTFNEIVNKYDFFKELRIKDRGNEV